MSSDAILATGVAATAIGALWRRCYGGWLALDRATLLIVAVILFSIPAWWVWDTPDTCWRPILIQVAIALQFSLGVQFDEFWLCALRYTLGPVLLFVVSAHLHPDPMLLLPLAIGPAIAAVYYLGARSTAAGHPWVIHWPWDTATQQMTNGYTAFGELAAGGLSVMAFVMIPLMEAK